MNKKRLIRDTKMFFQSYPYHQLYMDNELVKGWVAINYLTDGAALCWNCFPKANSVQVTGKDVTWLTIIPENMARSVTAIFLPDRKISVWYIDVIENHGIDDDGIVYFNDKYLDVMLTSQGDVITDDRDELDAAYKSGELNKMQYENALKEGELIIKDYATDIANTEKWCRAILEKAEEIIKDDIFTIFAKINESNELNAFAERTKGKLLDARNMNYDEILLYLKNHKSVKRYVVFDYGSGKAAEIAPEIKKHLVSVDKANGLQKENLIEGCRIMNTIELPQA